ncbi:allantoate amidohydrolase [Bacillus cereus]|uniref:allantoate deiminase n=1 Tax=Bacillus cereus group TaxID=86661 RepID=UPI000BEB6864|nr:MULTISPECIES: allantoate deiminase [Bacillus cereus group]MDF9495403.1 allantoate deiminase [Bacillus cereus]MEE3960073.1 allantoate deiminase [Bacillus thuringiensis]PDY15935.1 allantoate amidohydrolase [Bacillus cereus]PDZ37991.1 allantoate amidohydrolase [Bacillus cereus]PET37752.1 allantoate amidohydrolase [Bacillus cereus]
MHTLDKLQLGKDTLDLLHWLGECGKDPEGGVSRFLYSSEWLEAQESLKTLFIKEELSIHYDEIGNLFGMLEGSKYKDETILTGSHVDTVKNGGLFDGQYGIIAGFLAIKYLKEKYGQPLRNIEVVSMAEEEGSRFPYTFWGSKNIVGIAKQEDVQNISDFNGQAFVEVMRRTGFTFKANPEYARKDIKAFVELHVEQGEVLEKEERSIGIVQNIVGQRRFTVEIIGESNHAGTTPMKYRKDAMSAASYMIHRIHTMTLEHGEPLVATVGEIKVEPNIVNVVPGKAIFTIDVRHVEKEELHQFTDKIVQEMNKVANQLGVQIKIKMWMDAAPVPMDRDITDIIEKQCLQNNIVYKMMHSGAGHDAQIIAPYIPTAMVFVPSHKGISHSPFEYTDPKDLAEGVNVLIHTLYELAY